MTLNTSACPVPRSTKLQCTVSSSSSYSTIPKKIKPMTERKTDHAPFPNSAPGPMRFSKPKMKPRQKEKIQPAPKLSPRLH